MYMQCPRSPQTVMCFWQTSHWYGFSLWILWWSAQWDLFQNISYSEGIGITSYKFVTIYKNLGVKKCLEEIYDF